MKAHFISLRVVLALTGAAISSFFPQASAATYTWTNITTGAQDWTTAGNWFGSTQYVSNPSNELMFFADSTTNISPITQTFTNVPTTLSMNTLTLNGKGWTSGASSSNITIGSSASTWTIGDGTTSTVNLNAVWGGSSAANIYYNVAANLTLNQATTLFTGNGTAGVHTGANDPGFVFSGSIGQAAAGYGITKSGTSRLTLSGNSLTFTGPLTVNGGSLFLTGNSNPGFAMTVNSGAILRIGNNTATQLSSGNYAGNISTGTGGTLQLWSTSAQEFSGIISGSGGINKAYGGTLTLSGANTYTGQTQFRPQTTAGFTVNVSSFDYVTSGSWANHGLGSSLGAPTTIANGTIDLGDGGKQASVNLTYTGAAALGETTDRVINLGFNGTSSLTITANNASGVLRFTSAFTSNTGTSGQLILRGTGAGQIDQGLPQIANGGLNKNDSGTWTLGGSGNFTGSTIITAGILSLNSATALQNSPFNTASVAGNATNGLRIATTTLTLGGLTGSNALDTRFTTTSGGYSGLTALTLNTASGATPSYSGAIVDGATGMTLTKSGAGTQTLSGANAFTGATSVSAGTLILDYATQNNSKLSDSASLILGNATLTLSGGSHTEVVSSTTLNANTASSITRSSGTTVLQLGNITVNTGSSLNFGASGIATTNNTNNSLGILGYWATITGEGWAVNSTNGANGLITGATYTDVTRLSSGTKTISTGANHFRIIEGTGTVGDVTMASAGATSIDSLVNTATTAGTVDIGTGNTLRTNAILQGSGTGTLTIGLLATPGTLTALTAGGDLSVIANSAITINSVIANNTSASTLTKYGTGQLTITTNPTYTGATIMNGGTLVVSGIAGNPLSNSSGLTFTGTSAFTYLAANISLPSTTINSGVTANFSNTSSGSIFTFTIPSLSGSGTFSADNPGGTGQGKTIAFTDLSNFTGVLQMNLTGASFNFNVSNLNDTVANNIRFAGNGGVVTSPNRFRYVGSAGLTLNNRAIEYASNSGAFLSLDNNGTSNSSFIINSNLAVTSAGAKTLQLGGTNTGGTSTFAGNIVDGTGAVISLTKADANTWSLTSTGNTFTGTINVGAGHLNYASAGGGNGITFSNTTGTVTLAYTGATDKIMSGAMNAGTVTSGTINLLSTGAGAVNYSNTASLGSTGSLVKNLVLSGTNTGDNIFAGRWVNNGTGAATLAKQGSGRWILTNANNSYSGGTTIGNNTANAGILDVRASGALGTGTVSIVSNTGNGNLAQLALNHATGITLTNNFSTSGVNGVILNQSGNNVISGNIALIGGGGNTTINSDGGSLTLSGGISINVAFDRTLTLGGSAAGTVSGVISNGVSPQVLSVVKSDAGTWTFSNNSNTYTGTTTVSQGTLVVNGSIATSSLTTVASGATVGGSGTTGALTVSTGGFISAGDSIDNTNVLSVTGAYTQAGLYTADVLETGAGNFDQISVTGAVDITGGSLTAAFAGGTYALNDLILILLNDSSDAITGTYAGYANGATVATYGGFNWNISYFADSGTSSFTGGNDIALMAEAIPEPKAVLLGVLGLLLLLRRRR